MKRLISALLLFAAGLALGLVWSTQPPADSLAGMVITIARAEGPGPMSGADCRRVSQFEFICHGEGPWQLHLDGWKQPQGLLEPNTNHYGLLAGLP